MYSILCPTFTYQEKADILKSHPEINQLLDYHYYYFLEESTFICRCKLWNNFCMYGLFACIDTIIFNITQAMGQPFAVKQT